MTSKLTITAVETALADVDHYNSLGFYESTDADKIRYQAALDLFPDALRLLLPVVRAAMALRDKLESGKGDDYQTEMKLLEALEALEE